MFLVLCFPLWCLFFANFLHAFSHLLTVCPMIYPPVESCCLLTRTPAEVVWTSSMATITAQQLRDSRDSILSSSLALALGL